MGKTLHRILIVKLRKQALKRDFRKNYPNVTELDTVKDPQSINNLMKKMEDDMSKTRTRRSTDFQV